MKEQHRRHWRHLVRVLNNAQLVTDRHGDSRSFQSLIEVIDEFGKLVHTLMCEVPLMDLVVIIKKKNCFCCRHHVFG